MALDTSLSRNSAGSAQSTAAPWTISTRLALLCVLLATMAVFTASSLWLIWHQVREQGARQEDTELSQSIRSFGAAEEERYASLERETALVAELPSLKALLTTNDDRTIQDAGVTFWKTGGGSLFALADTNGRVRAIYGPPGANLEALSRDLSLSLPQEGKRYLVSSGRLFHYASSPVYFGDALHGAQLGMAVDGYEIDTGMLRQLSQTSGTEAAFFSRHTLICASLPRTLIERATERTAPNSGMTRASDGNGYPSIAASRDLSSLANTSLQVVFQRSLIPAERTAHAVSRSILLLGFWMLIIGGCFITLVARQMTQPLESLARQVDAFGTEREHTRRVYRGTREIAQLEQNFTAMETRVSDLNRARLESEKLATIGSMATSVSHDLRHNLATIYAHAEFLMDVGPSREEREEFFENIKGAVLDTTEMLESLATFSRTGQAGRFAPERLDVVVRRAQAQVQLHPAAARVAFRTEVAPNSFVISCDAKQIERALRNVLLNACQARRPTGRESAVRTEVQCERDSVHVEVLDNGVGVSAEVQNSLFQPFVSAGKQDGTGLGLTLARRIAEDHGGSLDLRHTDGEGTLFVFTLPLLQDLQARVTVTHEVEA